MNLVERYLTSRLSKLIDDFNGKHCTSYFLQDGWLFDMYGDEVRVVDGKRVFGSPIKLCRITDIVGTEITDNCIYLELRNGDEVQMADIGWVPSYAMNYRREMK